MAESLGFVVTLPLGFDAAFRRTLRVAAVATALVLGTGPVLSGQEAAPGIPLPASRRVGTLSLEAALAARRSVRTLARDTIALADVGQLLWAANGVNRPDGHRTIPSAGGTNALEVRLLAARVRGLAPGIYRYRPAGHSLDLVRPGDPLTELLTAARQPWIGDAAAVIALSAVYQRTAQRYGARAERYVPIEAGSAAQSVYLQCAALGLGTTYVGSFNDSALARILSLPADETPLGLLPVGRPR